MVAALVDFANRALAGKHPVKFASLFASARLVPVPKESGDLRPLAVGLVLRRFVSRRAARHVRPEARVRLEPLQLGFSSWGTEAAVHAISRDVEHRGGDRQYVVATLDFTGAFPNVSRQCVVDEVASHAPCLLPWVSYTYGCSADLF